MRFKRDPHTSFYYQCDSSSDSVPQNAIKDNIKEELSK